MNTKNILGAALVAAVATAAVAPIARATDPRSDPTTIAAPLITNAGV